MFAYNSRFTALGIAIFLAFLPIAIYTITNASSDPAIPNFRRLNGNANASSDLYGIGIRVGIYLQVFGMLLSCIRYHKRSLTGIKLLSSSVCVSLLLTWTVSVSCQQISACEAWLILCLINVYATPRSAAIKHWEKGDGGGVSYSFSLVSLIWQCVAFIWFFATLVLQLPDLGTKNLIWFFTAVEISGWFRILMLIYSVVCCLCLPVEVVCYLYLIVTAFCNWTKLEVEEDEDGYLIISGGLEADEKPWTWSWLMRIIARMMIYMMNNVVFRKIDNWNFEWRKRICGIVRDDLEECEKKRRWNIFQNLEKKFWSYWGLFVLLLTIIGVEKIISYNELSPANNITSPGQIIPFVLGIITLVEGFASACTPTLLRRTGDVISNASNASIVDPDLEGQRRNTDQEWVIQEARFRQFGDRQMEECEK